ncbi:MAG: DUF3859 domain-containing protein [Spongiibacteraceae bacterium]|nr:DUF3859 domain-containing protein [Spongiibacteraceae bacterium]
MKYLMLLCVLFGSAWVNAVVDGDAYFSVSARVDDFGIYEMLSRSDTAFVAEATAGYSSVIHARLLEETKHVPLKKNIVFGFNYTIEDSTADTQWVPVIIRIKHPPTQNYLGHFSDGFVKDSAAKIKADGFYHNSAFYVLSEPYEMVAGPWSISVIYRGESVVNLDFVLD